MTAVDDADLSDLLPDDLLPDAPDSAEAGEATEPRDTEPSPVPVMGTSRTGLAPSVTGPAQSPAQAHAAMLAQIVNLHIAGYSLAEIGASIGATEGEVDRMLTRET